MFYLSPLIVVVEHRIKDQTQGGSTVDLIIIQKRYYYAGLPTCYYYYKYTNKTNYYKQTQNMFRTRQTVQTILMPVETETKKTVTTPDTNSTISTAKRLKMKI